MSAERNLMKFPALSLALQNPSIRQGLIFIAVGGAATATHVVTALAAQRLFAVSAVTANLIGYSAAVLVSYIGNAWLTFGRRLLHGPQFLRFMVVSLAGLALSQSLTFICVNRLHVPYAVALVPIVILVPIFSFVFSKLYAFADPSLRGAKVGDGAA